MIDKFNLAGYIVEKHFEDKQTYISPVTLQKSLFYIYAYGNFWSGIKAPLFEQQFRPLSLGPRDLDFPDELIPDITGSEENFPKNLKNSLLNLIDWVCSQTFEINDFALVDMSKDLNCYKQSVETKKEIIPSEWILKDFHKDMFDIAQMVE